MPSIDEIVSYFPGGKWSGKEYVCKCPLCDPSKKPKLYISVGADGKVLYSCKHEPELHTGPEILRKLGLPLDYLSTSDSQAPMPQQKKRQRKPWVEIPRCYYKHEDIPMEKSFPYTLDGKVLTIKVKYRHKDTGEKEMQWWTPVPGGYDPRQPEGVEIPFYNLDKLNQHNDPLVFICEGEKDCCTLEKFGLVALSSPNGAHGRWPSGYNSSLCCRDIVVLTDNDTPGEDYGRKAVEELRQTAQSIKVIPSKAIWEEVPEKGDITDIYDALGPEETKARLTAAVARFKPLPLADPKQAEDPAAAQTGSCSLLKKLSEVTYVEPTFLMDPYIPMGKITIVAGDSGIGKTALLCALAAKVSTGEPLLDTPTKKGNVIIVSVEDDPPTLMGRVKASGGDLDHVFFLEDAACKGLTFTSADIEAAIKEAQAKLIIFDPIQNFMGPIDMNKANETRPVLASLAAMATRNDCAVVLISHQGKAQQKAINRALGSVDIVAASRSMLLIGKSPDNPDERAAVHVKSSVAKNGKAFTYQIGDHGGVTFIDYADYDADDLERAQKRRSSGIPYEDEPLVATVRQIMADNPAGVFLPHSTIMRFGEEVLGYPPASNTRELSGKLSVLSRELLRHDHVAIELKSDRAKDYVMRGKQYSSEFTNPVRGFKFTPYTPPKSFQQSIEGGIPLCRR